MMLFFGLHLQLLLWVCFQAPTGMKNFGSPRQGLREVGFLPTERQGFQLLVCDSALLPRRETGSMQTDMAAENIQTPGGDMEIAASETMEAPTPSQDPYMLLRARLPREITDDVVRLIATNPEAFKDFAAIETQEDVIDFNATYGVELVLPAQQV